MSSFYDTKTNLLFIHIPKTAGSAITNFICSDLPDYDGPKEENQEFIRLGRYHWSAKKIQEVYPDIFNNANSFAIVRNPFSWLQSVYYHQLQNTNTPYHDIAENKGFDYFLRHFTENDKRTLFSYVSNIQGEIAVKNIFRFEDFETKIIPFLKKYYMFDKLPERNVTQIKKKRLADEYSKETFNYVNKHYVDDIDKFGYRSFSDVFYTKLIKN